MSFQWIIDNAESISINSMPIVAQTISLDGTVRSTSYGGAAWRIEAKLPDGPRWSEYRNNIATAEALGKTTSANVQISNSGQTTWLNAYQGNAASTAGVTATYASGNTITLTAGLSTGSGYRLRAGDYVQLGASGSVYRVAADVLFSSSTVTLNRPVLEAAGSYSLLIGPAVTWTVRCIDFPQWNIFARDQVSWSGAFVFQEDLT
jgi:hypothetical protein